MSASNEAEHDETEPRWCPFCNSSHVEVQENAGFFWVKCLGCSVEGPNSTSAFAAVSVWNGPVRDSKASMDREHWRRVYAGQAMEALIRSGEASTLTVARWAHQYADALVKEMFDAEEKE